MTTMEKVNNKKTTVTMVMENDLRRFIAHDEGACDIYSHQSVGIYPLSPRSGQVGKLRCMTACDRLGYPQASLRLVPDWFTHLVAAKEGCFCLTAAVQPSTTNGFIMPTYPITDALRRP